MLQPRLVSKPSQVFVFVSAKRLCCCVLNVMVTAGVDRRSCAGLAVVFGTPPQAVLNGVCDRLLTWKRWFVLKRGCMTRSLLHLHHARNTASVLRIVQLAGPRR